MKGYHRYKLIINVFNSYVVYEEKIINVNSSDIDYVMKQVNNNYEPEHGVKSIEYLGEIE